MKKGEPIKHQLSFIFCSLFYYKLQFCFYHRLKFTLVNDKISNALCQFFNPHRILIVKGELSQALKGMHAGMIAVGNPGKPIKTAE